MVDVNEHHKGLAYPGKTTAINAADLSQIKLCVLSNHVTIMLWQSMDRGVWRIKFQLKTNWNKGESVKEKGIQ